MTNTPPPSMKKNPVSLHSLYISANSACNELDIFLHHIQTLSMGLVISGHNSHQIENGFFHPFLPQTKISRNMPVCANVSQAP